MRSSGSWERLQTSFFWPNTGFCIIHWLILFALKMHLTYRLSDAEFWNFHLHCFFLKWYWLSSENTKGYSDQPLQIIWLTVVNNLLIRWRRYRKIRKLQNAEIHLFHRKGCKEKEIIPVFHILQWLPSVLFAKLKMFCFILALKASTAESPLVTQCEKCSTEDHRAGTAPC